MSVIKSTPAQPIIPDNPPVTVGKDETYTVGVTPNAPVDGATVWIAPGVNTVNRRLLLGGITLNAEQVSYDPPSKTFSLLSGQFNTGDTYIVEQY